MANTTFANLKINALRRTSNQYNANDSTRLALAGSIINGILSEIQLEVPDSPFWRDLDNTVSTVASQEYVALTDTNIIDILAVYQRESDTKLKRISRNQFVKLQPDTTFGLGTPDYAYDVEQAVNGSGQNIFNLYLLPTPVAVITLRYDYLKNARFSVDGTGADSEYCPLPNAFDDLIYAMFAPKFYMIIDPSNTSRITSALRIADIAWSRFIPFLKTPSDKFMQAGSARYPSSNGLAFSWPKVDT